MSEFLHLLPPPDALYRVIAHLLARPNGESVETAEALGRITLESIVSPQPLPAFPRSTVDGYAVRAIDTFGASDTLPGYLKLIGEVPMGGAPSFALAPAQCALIHTGGMLPQGTDAVVMVEHTQSVCSDEVEILRPVAVGENVLKMGEDVALGEVVVAAGTQIRPAEVGGLLALGITQVMVASRPRVAVLSSGDEVVAPEAEVHPGQVRDINSYTLSALITQSGGTPVRYGIVPDDAGLLKAVAERALADCDLVVVTAGSSASARDLTASVINQLGKPGVLVHGVNVRPGKPTILAVCDGKAVIGLPGNPVSALVVASIFVSPVIEALLGLRQSRFKPSIPARLTINVPSMAGREDWIPVQLNLTEKGYEAEPLFGKSNLIFTLVRADGLFRIPPPTTGMPAGAMVEVMLI
jgi:molybdopterin molybdotransferase